MNRQTLLTLLVVGGLLIGVGQASAASTELISKRPNGSVTLSGLSRTSADRVVSADGRFVAFISEASNLVGGDTNGREDAFVRDRSNGTTQRVSIRPDGQQDAIGAVYVAISADGRYAVVQGDGIYIRDRQANSTIAVTNGPSSPPVYGSQPTISGNGRYVAFMTSDPLVVGTNAPPGAECVCVFDRQTRLIDRYMTRGSNDHPSLSNDGRYLVFSARDSQLIPNDTNQSWDVLLRDRQTRTTTLVSVDSAGRPQRYGDSVAPSISADGRYVAFASDAPALVAGDLNSSADVFVHDRLARATVRVSIDSNSEEAACVVIDEQTQCGSGAPSISANGRHVAFHSYAKNLVPGDTNEVSDIFVRDVWKGLTTRESVTSLGAQARSDDSLHIGTSMYPSIAANGLRLAFTSSAPNLFAGDNNILDDVFLRISNPSKAVVRVNSGGPEVFDTVGRRWEADRGFSVSATSSRGGPISGTTDPILYGTERWSRPTDPELRYRLAVPNGRYDVRLHFAETYPANFAAGKRVFNVRIEGALRFSGLDVFAAAGSRNALVKTATVDVADGALDIQLLRRIQNPFINAIEVIAR